MSDEPRDRIRPVCRNREVFHHYEVLDRFEAGLVLLGSEVKSLRAGRGSLDEAYIRFEGSEAWLVGAHIAPYPQANRMNHEPRRPRKLLLHAREALRLAIRARERGLTVVPISLYFKGPWLKIEIGLGRGKKLHDKRAAIKERQDLRDMERDARQRGRGDTGSGR
ncbi:MAG: SsrA-binding protein SmpB [Deltaproteobacteria bacterium]|nr:SsrA-binding protein SmpB [Deltaproteobacteria bacterium]